MPNPPCGFDECWLENQNVNIKGAVYPKIKIQSLSTQIHADGQSVKFF